jgi:hypothetical protein
LGVRATFALAASFGPTAPSMPGQPVRASAKTNVVARMLPASRTTG